MGDDPRDAILRRRAKFLAAALASVTAATNACGSEVQKPDDSTTATSGSGQGGAQVCLSAGGAQVCLSAPEVGGGGAQVCLGAPGPGGGGQGGSGGAQGGSGGAP